MSRPRKQGNSSLPDNLYRKHDKRAGKVYYTYRNPQSGTSHGLGTDHESAVNDARALNAAIYASIRSATLAAIVAPKADTPTFSKVLKRHLELCDKRKLSPKTMIGKKNMGAIWEGLLGNDTPLGNITLRQIVEILESYEDRPTMAKSMRSCAIEIWKDAIQEGWANDNLPAKTRGQSVDVVRSRLTLDDFKLIHAAALTMSMPWIARSMELALVTAQRREDIAVMEFRKGKDSSAWVDDALYVEQLKSKCKNKLRIPFDVGVNGWTIGDVIKSCRDNVISKWLIHHQVAHTGVVLGNQVWLDTITKGFSRARKLAGVIGEGKTPPSFHEIRSLAIRMYADQYGHDFAQAIAGHKDAATSALYRDTRGAEWVQVRAV